MKDTVTITREINKTDFWSNIMGSLSFSFDWWLSVKYLNGADWDKPGEVQLGILDENNEKLFRTLTLEDLVTAYTLVIDKGYYHCNGMPVDIEDMDECTSDMVLQAAMLGDVVYG